MHEKLVLLYSLLLPNVDKVKRIFLILNVVAQIKFQTNFSTEAANMTGERLFQKDFKSMSALGRNFKVGDLYNYYDDQTWPSGSL